jgi:FdhE protein
MTGAALAIDDLRRRRKEWAPWLAVVAEVVHEAHARAWDAAVPSAGDAATATVAPRLAGVALSLSAREARRFLKRLIRIASQAGSPKLATLRGAQTADLDVLALFAASVCQDGDSITAAAARSGSDAEALQAVVALLAVPFLHACARRFAPSISPGWEQAYCPVCGSWPSFAEVRGIERSRAYRCGRCGAEWHARALCCPYCGTMEHDELVALVPEQANVHAAASEPSGDLRPVRGRAGAWGDVPLERAGVPFERAGIGGGAPFEIDACNGCRGYVKTFNRLQACPAETVMLEDLASVELDVAALDQGYKRPAGAGYPLGVHVNDQAPPRRRFRWHA